MMVAVRDAMSDWVRECASVAEEILGACGIEEPPVNAWEIARTLGLRVAFDSWQQGRGRLKRIGGQTAILMRPDERPEREQWTLAHEIGEAVAHRVYARLEVDPQDVPPQRREQVANEMASSLLLPGEWFQRDAAAWDGDVLRLKGIYSTVSHELILMNLLKAAGVDAGERVRPGKGDAPARKRAVVAAAAAAAGAEDLAGGARDR